MAKIGNVTVRVDAVITDEQYHEAMSAVSAANEYIAALEAENAKLQASNEVIAEDHAALCEQNAKLRELVLHMVECVRRLDSTSEDGGCSLCPYQSIDYDCEFENRARDLGVEVDG